MSTKLTAVHVEPNQKVMAANTPPLELPQAEPGSRRKKRLGPPLTPETFIKPQTAYHQLHEPSTKPSRSSDPGVRFKIPLRQKWKETVGSHYHSSLPQESYPQHPGIPPLDQQTESLQPLPVQREVTFNLEEETPAPPLRRTRSDSGLGRHSFDLEKTSSTAPSPAPRPRTVNLSSSIVTPPTAPPLPPTPEAPSQLVTAQGRAKLGLGDITQSPPPPAKLTPLQEMQQWKIDMENFFRKTLLPKTFAQKELKIFSDTYLDHLNSGMFKQPIAKVLYEFMKGEWAGENYEFLRDASGYLASPTAEALQMLNAIYIGTINEHGSLIASEKAINLQNANTTLLQNEHQVLSTANEILSIIKNGPWVRFQASVLPVARSSQPE